MEIFRFNKDGNFNGDVTSTTTFERTFYTNEDVAMRILPAMYGLTIANDNLRYGQLDIITKMINRGWNLLPSFFNVGDKIVPNFGCFTTWCDIHGKVVQYICSIEFKTGEVELFNHEHKLGEFQSIDTMFDCMPQIFESEPLKCVEYNDSFISSNVTKFDVYGFDDEIFLEDNYVFGDMDASRCEFFLDKSKCHEIIFEKGE